MKLTRRNWERPRSVKSPNSLPYGSVCDNSSLLSFRGAEGDEESCRALVFRASFLAALGMTIIRAVVTQTPTGERLSDVRGRVRRFTFTLQPATPGNCAFRLPAREL